MPPLQDPDWVLIEKYFSGDLSAFHEIFSKHKKAAINLAFRVTGRRELAEDIAQDVFIKVYEKKLKVCSTAKFSTWLYRVTLNASLDCVRRKSFFSFSLDESKEPGETPPIENLADPKAGLPSGKLDEAETGALVRKAIEHLPEKLRVPLLLFEYEERSYEEIAGILQTSVKAVERRIYHARRELKGKLAKFFEY